MKKLIDCIKVDSKVFDIRFGWGIVNSLYADEEQFTPIEVVFKDGWTFFYTDEGKIEENYLNPSLFLHEIKLEQELPEFIEGEIVIVYHGKWVIAKYYSTDTGNKHNVFLSSNPGCIFSEILTQVLTVKSFDKSHFQQN
jgi:hypothetical protein